MKKIALGIIMLATTACGQHMVREKAYHAKQDAIIETHKKILVEAGRITDPDHFPPEVYIGTYSDIKGICDDGMKPTPCTFGSYTFSEEAFAQAKRMFVLHGQIAEGSDLLIDVGQGAFDKTVVGYDVGSMSYCSLHGGKLWHCYGADSFFQKSKVVEFIDKHTVRLDHKAKWDAEMYGLTVTPPDYVDMCNCIPD